MGPIKAKSNWWKKIRAVTLADMSTSRDDFGDNQMVESDSDIK